MYVSKDETIYWNANNPTKLHRNVEKPMRTKLTEFFRNNAIEKQKPLPESVRKKPDGSIGPHGYELLYYQYAEYYAWSNVTNEWVRRTTKCKAPTIGRIQLTNVNERVRHFMRLLLLTTPGAISWKDLKTVNGTEYETYIEACKEKGLLENDQEHWRCLEEACAFKNARALRTLFVTLLMWSQPVDPLDLWDHFKNELCSDIRYAQNSDEYTEAIYNTGKLKIHEQLCIYNKSLATYGFKIPNINDCCVDAAICAEIREELDYDVDQCKKLYTERETQFNTQQKKIYNVIKSAIDNNETGFGFYVDGVGGAGKSFVANALLSYVRSQGKIALSTATTGIAATILLGARTFHSRFNCPRDINDLNCDAELFDISRNSGLAKLLTKTDLIVIDEITTLSKTAIEVLNNTLKYILKTDKFMGGKIVVLMGDFKQCLPIVSDGNWASSINMCMNNSEIWHKFKPYRLTENMRLKNDPVSQKYANQILDIGNGIFPTHSINGVDDLIQIPEQWLLKSNKLDDLINKSYHNINTNYTNPKYFADRAILTPLNEDVWDINEKVLEKIPGETYFKHSEDRIIRDEYCWEYPTERLWDFNTGNFPLHELKLKKHAPMMILRNIASRDGLCNGTRFTVEEVKDNIIVGKLLTGARCGQKVFIHKIILNQDKKNVFLPFQRRQYPIQLAFAMTCNKSQGQTLEQLGLYLPNAVFAHGQLYTALSRIKNPNLLDILIVNTTEQGTFDGHDGVYTQNIVHKRALNKYNDNNSSQQNSNNNTQRNNIIEINSSQQNSNNNNQTNNITDINLSQQCNEENSDLSDDFSEDFSEWNAWINCND